MIDIDLFCKYYPVCDLECDKIIVINNEIKIIPKKLLSEETINYGKIINSFKKASCFIKVLDCHNRFVEINTIKKFISIIFMANCLSSNSNRNFNDNPFVYLQEFSINFFTTKLGASPVDENYFDERLFGYPECLEERTALIRKPLFLTENKNDIIGGAKYSSYYYFEKICNFLEKNSELSERLNTCFLIMYDFIYYKFDINFFLFSSQVLEVLLLKKGENAKKNRISNRGTALILEYHSVDKKIYLANRIAKLYKDRSDIVHEGKNYLSFYRENPRNLSFDINFSKNLFIKVIEIILEKNFDSVEDIEIFVKSVFKKDNVKNYYSSNNS